MSNQLLVGDSDSTERALHRVFELVEDFRVAIHVASSSAQAMQLHERVLAAETLFAQLTNEALCKAEEF